MSRYNQLIEIVRDLKPHHIVEIGTWNGRRAIQMMGVCNAYYTGFDLFEDATEATDKAEYNLKAHSEIIEVGQYLETAGFSKFSLIRGNSNETLAKWDKQPFDFVFIDGGHSVKTIQNDYEWAAQNIDKDGTIILDDWYDPALSDMGCNFLDGEVLPSSDKTPHGIVHLLRM